MIKNPSRLLFYSTLLAGTFMAVSSTSWLGCWIGLEINLLSFIPVMHRMSQFASEAALKYFLVQALASSLLLLFILLFSFHEQMAWAAACEGELSLNILILLALLLKVGAAPFHFWFPGVAEGLSWNNLVVLMTWQKAAPFILINYTVGTSFLITTSIILSSLVGAVGGFNQVSLRKIMAFSSINHIAWMLGAFLVSEVLWLTYFVLYSLLSMAVLFLFLNLNISYLNQLSSLGNLTPQWKLLSFGSLLSIGGLPPFLGFLPKWLVLQNLMCTGLTAAAVWMTMMSLITLYFYVRITYSAMVLTHTELKWMTNYYPGISMTTGLLTMVSIVGLGFSSLWAFMT